ncbi:MAG: carbohydrate-binding domain-containing protein [Candidatus Omnitrophota bacterium]|jgi:tetratricopeptide (TPR) repeat protein
MKNKIRCAVINIILIAFIVLSGFIITRPLLAEIYFNRAGFSDAIRTDPFSSRYPAGFGEAILKEKRYHDDAAYLDRATRFYERALQLNPGCADYSLKLGQIEIALFLKDETKTGLIKSAFNNFRRAIKNDPNGFNISYSAGYAGISVWKFLDHDEKEFILDRLKYSLRVRPLYSRYIYPELWNETMDLNLLRRLEPPGREPDGYISRLERMERIRSTARRTLNVAKVVIESDWHGISYDKKNVYVDGNMFWAGTIDAAIIMPRGKSTIKIQAKGSPADGIFPYMMVELDGRIVGKAYIRNTDWVDYKFTVNTDGGIKVLGVTYVNDSTDPVKAEDRNLYIGRAEAI